MGWRQRQQLTRPASTSGFHWALSLRWALSYPRWCAVPRACSLARVWWVQCGVPASTTTGQRGVAQILYSVMRGSPAGVCMGVQCGGLMLGALMRGKSGGVVRRCYCRACVARWRAGCVVPSSGRGLPGRCYRGCFAGGLLAGVLSYRGLVRGCVAAGLSCSGLCVPGCCAGGLVLLPRLARGSSVLGCLSGALLVELQQLCARPCWLRIRWAGLKQKYP